MENQNKANNYNSYYYVPALICGVLTACVITCSVLSMIIGAVLGLLTAGFWINVVLKSGEEA